VDALRCSDAGGAPEVPVIRVTANSTLRRSAAIVALAGVVALAAIAGMAQTGRYTVRRGDTLSSIALRQNRSVDAIAQANGITDPNRIFSGQVLSIPDPGSVASPTGSTVVVQAGDSLGRISARTGVPVATLIAANGLVKPYYVYTGGQLLVGVRNAAATAPLARCPVPGATFMNDWGFPRADTGFHQGNDLMAKRGTSIVAPVSGTVTQGVGTIGGNFFRLVGADGTSYYGAHLNSFGKTGKVKAGDVLGTVGNTGDAAGGATHLHFEIHPVGAAAINPYSFLIAACR
jgi:murein DD-endopeptidase MepM/ murein hydrolase activator NlpD